METAVDFHEHLKKIPLEYESGSLAALVEKIGKVDVTIRAQVTGKEGFYREYRVMPGVFFVHPLDYSRLRTLKRQLGWLKEMGCNGQ